MKRYAVPVVMYHSVGIMNKNWIWNHLICPLDLFEKHLLYLKKRKMQTISLQQLYDYRVGKFNLPENSIVLTFDDGYLDNWVFVYPLLKKYGFKGTIFVSPEFIDQKNIVRKNLFDVWDNKLKKEDLETKGFLSWEEMKIMESEGVMDIQSHSMTHTWYFTDDIIIDFHHPGNKKYPWLFWNAYPERKCHYLNEDQEKLLPYGLPIYRHGRSLGIRRYLEDKGLSEHMVNYVKEQGLEFFKRSDWRDKLFKEVENYKCSKGVKGRYETDEEMIKRYRYELFESKKILEDKLNKEIKFLCWPGGAFNDISLKIAKEVGYISTTLLFDDPNIKNTINEDPWIINRTGCRSAFYWRNRFISYTNPGFFIANLKYFQGFKIYIWIMRIYKIKYLIRYILTPKEERYESSFS